MNELAHSPLVQQLQHCVVDIRRTLRWCRPAAIFAAGLLILWMAAPCAAGQEPKPNPAPSSTPGSTPGQAPPTTESPAPDAAQPSAPAVQAPQDTAAEPITIQVTVPVAPAPSAATEPEVVLFTDAPKSGEVNDELLKRWLVGKPLFLRGGYLGDSLSFSEHGDPTGHPAVGSYTLSGVEIEKVRLTKHKVELIGSRYGLHFLGALPYEDPSKPVERVNITPKKKFLRITIDREQIVKEKKPHEKNAKSKEAKAAPKAGTVSPAAVASSETDVAAPVPDAPTAQSAATTAPSQASATATTPGAEAEPASSAMPTVAAPASPAAAQEAAEDKTDVAADQSSVTITTSPAHAAKVLQEALDRIFASGLDQRLRAKMPDFWQFYYQAQQSGVDYHPKDPSVLRANAVDQQVRVVSSIAPDSNEFAQASGIAGRALYRVVIGSDGRPGEIAVVRPIGFGLDENAVSAIRKATFAPAEKGGRPVAESIDLTVLFRIYSKRTSVSATDKPAEVIKPGPYTVNQPHPQPEETQQP